MKQSLQYFGAFALAGCMLFCTACTSRGVSKLKIEPSPEEEIQVFPKDEDSDKYLGKGKLEPEGFEFSGRIFMVGDSTMDESYSQNRIDSEDVMGWGKYFREFLTEPKEDDLKPIQVYNLADSGASSRSFTKTEQYAALRQNLSAGDYLIVQFGHNDEQKDSVDVYTGADVSRLVVDNFGRDENGTYSFEWILYNYYIAPALDVGAVPILVSPNARLNIVDGTPNVAGHKNYRDVISSLSLEFQIPFVDLTELSRVYYNQLFEEGGRTATEALHAYSDDRHSEINRSHLSQYGAYSIAGLVADKLSQMEIALAEFVVEPRIYISPR